VWNDVECEIGWLPQLNRITITSFGKVIPEITCVSRGCDQGIRTCSERCSHLLQGEVSCRVTESRSSCKCSGESIVSRHQNWHRNGYLVRGETGALARVRKRFYSALLNSRPPFSGTHLEHMSLNEASRKLQTELRQAVLEARSTSLTLIGILVVSVHRSEMRTYDG
jgi:hypothetical protein